MSTDQSVAKRTFIQLEMLSWFLKENLAHFCPDLFHHGALTVHPFSGQGVSNLTFVARDKANGEFFVRLKQLKGGWIPETEVAPTCYKESWVANIPQLKSLVPQSPSGGVGIIHDPSDEVSYSFMIQERLPYASGAKVKNPRAKEKILSQLGETLRLFEHVPCIGFGNDFLARARSFSHLTWQSWLYERSKSTALQTLRNIGILNHQQVKKFELLILSLELLQPSGVLFHSDFLRNWGNILIDENNNVKAIIDWELCGSGLGALEDLVSFEYVLIRDGIDKKQAQRERTALLEGYGLDYKNYRERFGPVIDILLAEKAVEKVFRYHMLSQQNRLVNDWQKTFAARAKEFLLEIVESSEALKSIPFDQVAA